MEKVQLPENLVNEFKCALCGECLSYPPITLHAETGSVCGRCPMLEAERNIVPLRESNYERLAKHLLLFSCRYKPQGCTGVFTMEEIPNHENVCHLKPFFCPVSPLGHCPWQGFPEESYMHFATDHSEFLLETNIFEVDLIHNYNCNYLLANQGDLVFLVHTEFLSDEGLFYCGIYQIMDMGRKFKYHLDFKSGDTQKKLTLGAKDVPALKQDIRKEDGFAANIIVIRDTLNCPSIITCTIEVKEIEVGASNCEEPTDLSVEIDEDDIDQETQRVIKVEDDKMLLDIECPVCQEFMIPPIYQCNKGHSVCGVCKPQLHECPTCRGQLGDIRNYTLEKITEHIMYQCKNRYDGCQYRANSKGIREHEAECKFSPVKCPFYESEECAWKGLTKAIVAHAKEDHSDQLIYEPLHILCPYVDDELGEEQRVTPAFGEIFRLRLGYNIEKKKVYATVQFVGPAEEADKYMYEVQVTDMNQKCMMLSSKKFCGSITAKKTDIAHCTVWPIDMIIPFMSEDQHIHAKYRIIRAKKTN